MPVVIRAFPLHKPLTELQTFAAAVQARRADATAFYRQFGVSHDSWHVQETPNGPWVIGITMIDNPPDAAPRFAKSVAEFDCWFKDQIKYLSGVDPNEQPLGPPTQQVYEWSDEARPNSNLCA